jgi:hypothetical protein
MTSAAAVTPVTVHPWLERSPGAAITRQMRGIWRARRLALLLLRRALAVARRPDVRFGRAVAGAGVSTSVRDAVPARMTTGPPTLLASGAPHVT